MKKLIPLLFLIFTVLPVHALISVTPAAGSDGNAVALQGRRVSANPPANTNVLSWNSTSQAWEPSSAGAGGSVSSVDMTVPSFLSVTGGPITSAGTFAVTLSGTALPLANGGTGQTTKAAAFNALSPMTTGGDLIYGGASGAGTRLANGSAGQVLTSQGTTLAPAWTTVTIDSLLPTQTGNSGKFLTTNGTAASWSSVTGFATTALDNLASVNINATTLKFAGAGGVSTKDITTTAKSSDLILRVGDVKSPSGGVAGDIIFSGGVNVDAPGASLGRVLLTNMNLTPTAPGGANLGDQTNYFDTLYLGSDIRDSAGARSVRVTARQLRNVGGSTLLDFSGSDLSANSHMITNVTDPVSAQDAATKNYVDSAGYMATDFSNNTDATADIDMNGHTISGLLDPVGAQDAATKNYVDSSVSGATKELDNLTTTNINADLVSNIGPYWYVKTQDNGAAATKGIVLKSGDTGNFTSGQAAVTTGSSQTQSGSIEITSGGGSAVNANSGDVELLSGNVTGAGISGSLNIQSGNTEDGNSGNINLLVAQPSGAGTIGHINTQGNLIPTADATYQLGEAAHRYDLIYGRVLVDSTDTVSYLVDDREIYDNTPLVAFSGNDRTLVGTDGANKVSWADDVNIGQTANFYLETTTQASFTAPAFSFHGENTDSTDFNVDMTSHGKIINLKDPGSNQDAATKKYVDDAIAGVSGGSGVTTMGAFGSTPNNNGASIATTTLTLQPADATHPGGVSTGTQTLAGAKTFSSALTASTSVTSPIFKSSTANPAASGIVRLANTDEIRWRNAANSGDKSLTFDNGDIFQFNAAVNSSSSITGSNLSGTNTGDVFNSTDVSNCSPSVSVAASAATYTVLDRGGSAISSTNKCVTRYHTGSLTNGSSVNGSLSAAPTMVVSNGSSLGCTASTTCTVYVYLIYNAGTEELAVINGFPLDEGQLYTTVAEGGAGAADSAGVLYSTTARTNTPVRLIGRVRIAPAAAFAWTNAATEASSRPFTSDKVDVWDGKIGLLVGADTGTSTRTDATNKTSIIASPHYTNAEEPVGMLRVSSQSAASFLDIGAGDAQTNAPTSIRMYTAANNTTTTGTARMTMTDTNIVTTLPMRGPGGSISSPTWSFSGDTNTGIYQASTSQLQIAVNGAQTSKFTANTALFSGGTGAASTGTSRMHIDSGNATAVNYQVTNGTTSGTTATDGLLVGLDSSANAQIKQQENLPMIFYTNSAEAVRILANGVTQYPATNTAAGTTGAQTINKPSGTVNFAASATSLVVTNSLITANSICDVRARTNDATCAVKNYVPTAGSMTINMNAACTAETSVGFLCFNN